MIPPIAPGLLPECPARKFLFISSRLSQYGASTSVSRALGKQHVAMEADAKVMPRMRFEELAQLRNHLHLFDGRTLLFCRDPRRILQAGSPVTVELLVTRGRLAATLSGTVLTRVGEGTRSSGAWLLFSDTKLARRLEADGSGLSARQQPRFACDFLAEVNYLGAPVLCRIEDVSAGGARLGDAAGLCPGMEIEVRVRGAGPDVPDSVGRAIVVRASGADAGVRFLRSDQATRQACTRLFDAVQKQRAAAPELMHLPVCCQGGRFLEPPLPRIRPRI